MAPSPDPITQAAAYQQHLLSLLGDDDPAQVQQGTEKALRVMVAEAGSTLRTRPAANEWSVLELLGHVADAEVVLAGRYRWALGHERPPLVGYDQDLWVSRLHHNDADLDELFELFVPLRTANLRLWRRSSAEERARVGVHAERGPESYEMMFRMLAGHDRFHLNQMRETLRQLRRAATS
jgi:DinB family protein